MSITNSVYLLAIIATPIDRAHCTEGHVFSAHVHKLPMNIGIHCSSQTSHIYNHIICSADAQCTRDMCYMYVEL